MFDFSRIAKWKIIDKQYRFVVLFCLCLTEAIEKMFSCLCAIILIRSCCFSPNAPSLNWGKLLLENALCCVNIVHTCRLVIDCLSVPSQSFALLLRWPISHWTTWHTHYQHDHHHHQQKPTVHTSSEFWRRFINQNVSLSLSPPRRLCSTLMHFALCMSSSSSGRDPKRLFHLRQTLVCRQLGFDSDGRRRAFFLFFRLLKLPLNRLTFGDAFTLLTFACLLVL